MPETFALLLLAVWAGAIVVLVNVDRADTFLWIPVLLAVTGVFSSILPLAMSFSVAVIANGATLILFMTSLEMLNPQHRLAISRIGHRTRQ
jgi:hypothetical protein